MSRVRPRVAGTGEARKVKARARGAARRVKARASSSESIADLHTATGRDLADDGRRSARRFRRVPSTAGFGFAPGRLSDHSDTDLLSWRQSGCGYFVDYGSHRKTVRPGAGPDPDDVDQLVRQFDHYAAVLARSEH